MRDRCSMVWVGIGLSAAISCAACSDPPTAPTSIAEPTTPESGGPSPVPTGALTAADSVDERAVLDDRVIAERAEVVAVATELTVTSRLRLESVLGGAPSERYGSVFVGCEFVMGEGFAEIRCPEGSPQPCTEIARHELTDNAGEEQVLGCGTLCETPDADDRLDYAYPVVVVVGGDAPLVAVTTSDDMSCGSLVSFRRAGRRSEMLLTGGGEDGVYRATYGLQRGYFTRTRLRYEESTY